MDEQRERILELLKRTGRNKLFFLIFAAGLLAGTLLVFLTLLLYPAAGVAGCLILCAALCAGMAYAVTIGLRRVARVVLDQDRELTKQLSKVSKNAKQHILLQLLQRGAAQDIRLQNLLAQSGFTFAHPYFCVAVMKLDDFWLASEEYSDRDIALFKFSMANIAVELAQIFKEAVGHEADYFGIGFSIGIGTVSDELSSISESYNNALDAVEYRLFFGKQSVTEYDGIKEQESVHIDYPYDMEQEILRQAMRFHNRVKTMEYLDIFLEQVGHIAAEDASLYVHQLGVAVNRALRQADKIQANHLYSMREFSRFMDSLPTLKEKQQQIKATLDELFTATAEDVGRKKQGIVQKVEEFVNENYQNPDITLEDMAQYVGLSSNYIRRIFREQCGYSPMDYLVNHRIHMAKELLKTTDRTAREIAGMVGYSNTKYFYSLFKKQTGYTTYEYRNKL